MWQMEGENPHVGDMISPTSLPRCARKLKLSRTQPYYVEPMSRWDATRGTLMHSFLEINGVDGIVSEKRIYKMVERGPMAPWLISGQLDMYSHHRRFIEDFKTTKENSIHFLFNQGPKEDHVAQLSVYRWLLNGGRVGGPDGEQVFWPVDGAQLHYCTMAGVYSTGTNVVERFPGKYAPNYGRPFKYEVKRDEVKTRKGYKAWDVTIAFPAVELWSLEETEAYVIDKGPRLVRGFREPDYMPPGIKDNEDALWECSYCEVRKPCDKIEEQVHELRWHETPLFGDAA